MNREIEFRGKRIDNGEWAEGLLVDDDGNYYIYHSYGVCPSGYSYLKGGGATVGFYIIVDFETIGQRIGLTDKNGAEMFEGDIITNYEFSSPLIIGFNKESASFCGSKTNNFDTQNCYWFFNDIVLSDGWEVIGNIYDNPERL